MARVAFVVMVLSGCRGVATTPGATPLVVDCGDIAVFSDDVVLTVPSRVLGTISAQCEVGEEDDGLKRARRSCVLRLRSRACELGADAIVIESVEMVPQDAPPAGVVYPVYVDLPLPSEFPPWAFELRWRARVLRYSDPPLD